MASFIFWDFYWYSFRKVIWFFRDSFANSEGYLFLYDKKTLNSPFSYFSLISFYFLYISFLMSMVFFLISFNSFAFRNSNSSLSLASYFTFFWSCSFFLFCYIIVLSIFIHLSRTDGFFQSLILIRLTLKFVLRFCLLFWFWYFPFSFFLYFVFQCSLRFRE